MRNRLAAYSCGGSHGIGREARPHRVPVSPIAKWAPKARYLLHASLRLTTRGFPGGTPLEHDVFRRKHVMAALDAAIHVHGPQEDVDGRVKPVQDDVPLFPSENVML